MKRILFIFFISSAMAQNSGFVDRDSALKLLSEYKEYELILDGKVKEAEDSMQVYSDWYNQLISQSHHFDTAQINQLERKIYQFQAKTQFELVALEDSLKDRLISILNLHASKFCEIHHIRILVDKNSILHCVECKDYMSEFVKFLQTQK